MSGVRASIRRAIPLLGALGMMGVAPPSGVDPSAAGALEPGPIRISPDIPVRRGSEAGGLAPGAGRALVMSGLLGVALLVGGVAVRRRRGVSADAARRLPWSRWLAPASGARPVRCLHSTRLTARASVHLLRWDDREWLVGCTDASVTVIGVRGASAEAQPPAREPSSDIDP